MAAMDRPLLLAVLAANALAFVLVGFDKWRARRGGRRLPEAWLLWAVFATGLFGGWLGVSLFRHKTRKRSFLWKLWVVSVLNPLWLLLWWQLRA